MGQWISPGIPVSSTNKTDLHDTAELLLKASLNTIALTLTQNTKPRDLEYSDYLTRYTDFAQYRSTCIEFMCDVTIQLIPDIFPVNCFFFSRWEFTNSGADPGQRTRRAPPKIEKYMIFWRKIVIFHTKYPNNFRTSLRSVQCF